MESYGYGRWSCYDIYFLTESPKWLIITLWLRDDNWRAFKNIEPKIMGQMPSDAFKHTIFIFFYIYIIRIFHMDWRNLMGNNVHNGMRMTRMTMMTMMTMTMTMTERDMKL
jgi:hypothetical protein